MAIYVKAVTVYTASKPARTMPIATALEYAIQNDATLILGGMRPGYKGREMVSIEELERWVHEDDEYAVWAAIADGEQAMLEMGLLR